MRIYADLHVHSLFSRATSSSMDIPRMAAGAAKKGLNLIGTGDFTHPAWLSKLREVLSESEFPGFFTYKDDINVFFILQTEINVEFYQNDSIKKIHLILLAPDFDSVEEVRRVLSKWGDLTSDGRPTVRVDAPTLVEEVTEADDRVEVIPAHIWTPWYSLFGSKHGFDSLEEAFGSQVGKIHALETGLSSDPPMNWRVSSLDRFKLISNSDAHSPHPWRIGREFNVFELSDLGYDGLLKALRSNSERNRLVMTVEVDPAYGKYHYDGHRSCGVRLHPREAKRLGNRCPVCGRPLTVGVLHRVEDLADRPEGYVPPGAPRFVDTVPLPVLISSVLGRSTYSRVVTNTYEELISKFGSEIELLLNSPMKEVVKVAGKRLGHALRAMRDGRLRIEPGYDGVYGEVKVDLDQVGSAGGRGSDFSGLEDYL